MRYKYGEEETVLEAVGEAPLLVEPVEATITFNNAKINSVIALDHDGRITDNEIKTRNGKLVINGSKSKTIWYLVKK